MKNIFPTFNEIDKGYQVFSQNTYRGLNDYGEPQYSEKYDLELVICHHAYAELVNKICISRNRKKEKTGFHFKLAGNNYAYSFEYSEKGWKECVNKIKEILKYYKNIIDIVLEE